VTFSVQDAAAPDLDAVVAAHLTAFPGFFMTLLGSRFLRVFYGHFVEVESGILLIARNGEGKILGCLAATRQPTKFFRTLRKRRGVTLLIAAIPALLRHPWDVAARLLSAVWYRGDRPPDLPGYWLLSSLAVREDSAGTGVGTALVERFIENARNTDSGGVYLVTDSDDNDRARIFYARRGFIMHSRFVRRNGRRLEVLVRGFK
jgi:GNAT superfamily N-acetyltransferase